MPVDFAAWYIPGPATGDRRRDARAKPGGRSFSNIRRRRCCHGSFAPSASIPPQTDPGFASIHKVRRTFLETDLRAKLARYHNDVDSAFFGWNDVWLDPAFREWDISDVVAQIACPVLAIQGDGDEYGTMAQIEGIQATLPDTQLLKLKDCGHSPQRDQPAAVIAASVAFISSAATRPALRKGSEDLP